MGSVLCVVEWSGGFGFGLVGGLDDDDYLASWQGKEEEAWREKGGCVGMGIVFLLVVIADW